MQITANQPINLAPTAAETPPAKPALTFPEQPVKDTVALNRVASLLNALQSDPHVRPEVVARGRLLAINPNYPPADVINKLAGLMTSSSASA